MSHNGTTHLERTVAVPRETVTATGKIVDVTLLSKTVMGINIHVPNAAFKFKAGQWVDFMIPGLDTVGGFSMKSSPKKLERDRTIELAVKKSNHPPAHWVHSQCQVGNEVSLKVGGDFFYDPKSENSNKLLLIAGGVGINPLYSILQEVYQSLQDGLLDENMNIALLYSASSLDELIFKEELEAMSQATKNIKVEMFVTQECFATGNNKTYSKVKFSRINATVLEKTLNDFNDKDAVTAYVCGPPPMIEFVSITLEHAGLHKNNIKREQWW